MWQLPCPHQVSIKTNYKTLKHESMKPTTDLKSFSSGMLWRLIPRSSFHNKEREQTVMKFTITCDKWTSLYYSTDYQSSLFFRRYFIFQCFLFLFCVPALQNSNAGLHLDLWSLHFHETPHTTTNRDMNKHEWNSVIIITTNWKTTHWKYRICNHFIEQMK